MAILLKARGLKKAQSNLKKTARHVRIVLLESIEEAARLIERQLKEKRLRGGNPLHARSGRLMKSVHTKIVKSKMSAFVGTPSPYAGIHEEGGVITPRNARLLTIPLKAARTASGMAKGTAREVGARYAHTFWFADDDETDGRPILFGLTETEKLVPLFLGVKRVVIPKREPFAKAQRDKEKEVFRLTRKKVRTMVERTNR